MWCTRQDAPRRIVRWQPAPSSSPAQQHPEERPQTAKILSPVSNRPANALLVVSRNDKPLEAKISAAEKVSPVRPQPKDEDEDDVLSIYASDFEPDPSPEAPVEV